jgi:N-acetyl-gamma-glutamyl-phosphate reductase
MTRTPRVFIDGQAGTTGLRIHELLGGREDLELLEIDPAQRKDPRARARLLNDADVSILCLPDDAAREAVALIESPNAKVIDSSTAHRVHEDWTYGLPELTSGQRAAVAASKRVGNPGCYPTTVCLLLRPLVDAGLVPPETPLTVHALSGYTGGGNAMIARWEDAQVGLQTLAFESPYALERKHKHVPEMIAYSALQSEPQFVPAVGPFRCGMRTQIPLPKGSLPATSDAEAIHAALDARYRGERFVRVLPLGGGQPGDERSLDPRACNDTNRVELRVLPHPSGHVLLMAVLDNLGKGASGAAVQSLNLMLGLPEDRGLRA